jgi:hypothetical protein
MNGDLGSAFMRPTISCRRKKLLLGAAAAALAVSLQSAPRTAYSKSNKAFYANKELVAFVRPGLKIAINSAEIAADGTMSTTLTITDPVNAPLDRLGVASPGVVSLSFVAARIPRGQTQDLRFNNDVQWPPQEPAISATRGLPRMARIATRLRCASYATILR